MGEKEERERERKKKIIIIKNKRPAVYVRGWVGERKEREEKIKKKSNGNVSCLKRYQWSLKKNK